MAWPGSDAPSGKDTSLVARTADESAPTGSGRSTCPFVLGSHWHLAGSGRSVVARGGGWVVALDARGPRYPTHGARVINGSGTSGHAGRSIRSADQRLGVLDDRFGEADVVAVPIAVLVFAGCGSIAVGSLPLPGVAVAVGFGRATNTDRRAPASGATRRAAGHDPLIGGGIQPWAVAQMEDRSGRYPLSLPDGR